MITKMYTDIDQSKKLEKILPLESADMAWYSSYAKDGYSIRILNDAYPLDIIGEVHDDIPCWSLAALLNYIKDKCVYSELIYLKSTYDSKENKLENIYRFSTDIYDVYEKEAVDACYEMIIKLYEQKLL